MTDVTVSDNTVILTKKDGTTEIIKIEEGDKVAIVSTDGSGGAVHVVDQCSGRVYTTPKKKAGGKKGSGSVGTAATTGQYGCVVDFKAPTTMRFGYDPVGDGKSKPEAYFHRNKSGDLIPWKSIQSGSTDFMDVVIKGDCHPDSLRYLRESGLITPSTPQDKGSRLMITGLADGEEDILTVAVAKTEHINDSTSREILTEAGALGLVAYDAIGKDVVLVPVNDAQCPMNPGIIKTELDKLFGPAVTSWQVEIQEPLEVEGISADAFKTSGNGFAARYTKDMKEVIKTFKRAHNKERKTLYLFFVNAPNADRAGYMPLAGDYGFIFNFGSNTNVIGHELAHGTFNLRHTFSDQAQHFLPEKSTKNLMDYANGTELWKYQWDLIHKPETILFDAFDEEEGAYGTGDINENTLNFTGDNYQKITTKINDEAVCYFGNGGSGKIKIEFNPIFKGKEEYTNTLYVKTKVMQGKNLLNDETIILKAGKDKKSGGYTTKKNFSFGLESKIAQHNNISITCYWSADGKNNWQQIMDYSPIIYTTLRKAANDQYGNKCNLDERLLYFTCSLSPDYSETSVFNAIWSKFTSLKLSTNDFGLSNNLPIGYYFSGNSANSFENLLLYKSGICNAFQDLMIKALQNQGLSAKYVSISMDTDEGFLVKAWKYNGAGTSGNNDYPYINHFNLNSYEPPFLTSGKYRWTGTPEVERIHDDANNLGGQNNNKPPANFYNHQVVEYNGSIYDPSYGKSFDNIEKWKDGSIDGVYIIDEGRLRNGKKVNAWLIKKNK